jgi:hypothetical protein
LTATSADSRIEASRTRAGVIDPVRASRDGHAYHEAWAARVALELVVPTTSLTALALEGFSIEDSAGVSKEATEIADLVRYRGGTDLLTASAVEVVQFKYSIARAGVPMRAADVSKTLAKFAKVELDARERLGLERTDAVVSYELCTNRPIDPVLLAAVEGMRSQAALEGDAERQAAAIRSAIDLPDELLPSFLARLTLVGAGGGLTGVKAAAHRTIADWGGASDALAQVRLAHLRELVREKAGGSGQHDNLIDRVAVLVAIDVAHERELFPTPEAFSAIGVAVERSAGRTLIDQVGDGMAPLIVHAAGGMGKTVLMQALAQQLCQRDTVVMFDGFGAGRWRAPEDARHLPKRSLPHLANLLAAQGLCDILLPSSSTDDLMRAFRLRLEQAVQTVRRRDEHARVVLLLDAIEHAAMQAQETRSESFAHALLQSLALGPIPGVAVVASCRTERLDLARGTARCRLFSVPPFTMEESEQLIRVRGSNASPDEVSVLHARSGGSPRCLDALLAMGRPYDAPQAGDANATTGVWMRSFSRGSRGPWSTPTRKGCRRMPCAPCSPGSRCFPRPSRSPS